MSLTTGVSNFQSGGCTWEEERELGKPRSRVGGKIYQIFETCHVWFGLKMDPLKIIRELGDQSSSQKKSGELQKCENVRGVGKSHMSPRTRVLGSRSRIFIPCRETWRKRWNSIRGWIKELKKAIWRKGTCPSTDELLAHFSQMSSRNSILVLFHILLAPIFVAPL